MPRRAGELRDQVHYPHEDLLDRGVDGPQAREIGRYADGVIVGSALVKTLLDTDPERGLAALAEATKELSDGVRR